MMANDRSMGELNTLRPFAKNDNTSAIADHFLSFDQTSMVRKISLFLIKLK